MISSQGANAFGPTGTAADILGFANRWQTASDAGRTSGMDLMADVYNANQLQNKLNTQGTEQLLGRMGQATDLFTSANDQLEQRAALFVNQCIAGGGNPSSCRAQFDAMVGRTPQQTQTYTPDPTMAPSLNISNFLGM